MRQVGKGEKFPISPLQPSTQSVKYSAWKPAFLHLEEMSHVVSHSSWPFSAVAQLLTVSTRSSSLPKTKATKAALLTWHRQKKALLTIDYLWVHCTPTVCLQRRGIPPARCFTLPAPQPAGESGRVTLYRRGSQSLKGRIQDDTFIEAVETRIQI